MALDYSALKSELTTDPLARGYGPMSDSAAAIDLNTVYRPSPAPLLDILQYIVELNHRTQQGTDTTYSTILGRLYHAAESTVGGDPFGRGVGNEITLVQLHACKFFIALFESPQIASIDYGDTNLPTGQVNGAGVWSAGHATAIEALSDSKISRAAELGFPVLGAGDVAIARALP